MAEMFDLYRSEILFRTNLEERERALEDLLLLRSIAGQRRIGSHAMAGTGRFLIRIGKRLEATEHRGQDTGNISEPCFRPGC